MGKPTGFLDYKRENDLEIAAEGTNSRTLMNFILRFLWKSSAAAGRTVHGVRCTVLPGGHDDRRHGLRLPAEQPGAGVERSGISR